MNVFEWASKRKLRFDYNGKLAVEDLWDLPLSALDEIYGKLRVEEKASDNDSLLRVETPVSLALEHKIELVKHIVATRLQEKDARLERASIKMQREKIAGIIEKKKDEGLESMSIAELEKTMSGLKA